MKLRPGESIEVLGPSYMLSNAELQAAIDAAGILMVRLDAGSATHTVVVEHLRQLFSMQIRRATLIDRPFVESADS